jgi:hypothetical protein
MTTLSIQQWNSLLSGTGLAAEVSASSQDYFAFVVVNASNPIKYINSSEVSNVQFWIRSYEIPRNYVEGELDVSEDELVNSIHLKQILGKEELERKLSNFIEDFNLLVPEWRCRNPL